MGNNVNVFDVAAHILQKYGSMTAMKLQKLVYYCQAWSLVWDEQPLFSEKLPRFVSELISEKGFLPKNRDFFAISACYFPPKNCVQNVTKKHEVFSAISCYY